MVIPDFLPTEDFKQLKQEFDVIISQSENVKVVQKGSLQINIRCVKNNEYDEFPAMQKLAKNEQLIRLISVGEGLKVVDQLKRLDLETSKFGDPEQDIDQNIPFHSDVHFHAHKVLFYMNAKKK